MQTSRVQSHRRASSSQSFTAPSTRARCRTRVVVSATRKILPIFPLNVVALPAASTPLMIFEARYRVLFNTLLDGAPGVEEGLVQKDSPFVGSRRFGMAYVDNEGRLAGVGCELEVMDFAHVEDGRIFLTNKGREKFRITNIVKEKPILLCEVEMVEEQEDSSSEAKELAKEVADLMRSTIRLNVKMNAIKASEDQLEPEELAELGPRELSYWIASFFGDVKILQQSLLEESSTMKRLQKEKEILSETVRYYSAASALKSAFNPGGAPGGGEPSPGSSGEARGSN